MTEANHPSLPELAAWLATEAQAEESTSDVGRHVAQCPACQDRLVRVELHLELDLVCDEAGLLAHSADCPTDVALTAFATDRLPDDERAEVAAHVEHCPTCTEVLAASCQLIHPAPPQLAAMAAPVSLPASRPDRRRWAWRPAAGLAAAVLLVAGLIWLIANSTPAHAREYPDWFYRGRDLIANGELIAALDLLEQRVAREPDVAPAMALYAVTLAKRGSEPEAFALAHRLAEREPHRWAGHAILAALYRQTGQLELLEQHQARAEALAPPRGSPGYCDWLYCRYMLQGPDEDPFARLDELLAIDPTHAAALEARARQATRSGRLELAEQDTATLIEHYPEWPWTWSCAAWLARRHYQWDKQVAYLSQAIARAPVPCVSYHLRRAIGFRHLGDWEAARREYERVLAIGGGPNATGLAYHGLALTHRDYGRYDTALVYLDRAIETLAEPAEYPQRCRGVLYLIRGDLPAARADFERCCQLTPCRAYGVYLLWETEKLAGHDEAARRVLAAGRADIVNRPRWERLLLQHLAGELSAEAWLAQAEHDYQRCELYYYVGAKLWHDGKSAEARVWLQRCVDAGFPHFNEYHLAKAWLARIEGESR